MIKIDPNDASGHFYLGSVLRKQGRRDEAIVELRKARDNAPPGSSFAEYIERALAESEQ